MEAAAAEVIRLPALPAALGRRWRAVLGAEVGSYLPEDAQGGKKAGQVHRSGEPPPPPFPCWELIHRRPGGRRHFGHLLAISSACFSSCRLNCILVALIRACVFKEVELVRGPQREPTRTPALVLDGEGRALEIPAHWPEHPASCTA